MQLTMKGIREAYPKWKRVNSEDTNLFNSYVIRPVSFYIVWLFARLGISPNATSWIALGVGIISCYFLATGQYLMVVIGACLLNVQLLMDCVDGGLARALDRVSGKGYYLDAIGGHTVNLLTPISVSIGLYLHPQLGIPGVYYLLMGVLMVILRSMRILGGLERQVAFGASSNGNLKPGNGKPTILGMAYKIGTILSTDFRTILLILVVLNLAWLYIFFYIAVFAMELLAVVGITILHPPQEKK